MNDVLTGSPSKFLLQAGQYTIEQIDVAGKRGKERDRWYVRCATNMRGGALLNGDLKAVKQELKKLNPTTTWAVDGEFYLPEDLTA